MPNKLRTIILFGVYLIVLLFATVHFTIKLLDVAAKESFKKLYSAYSQALLLTVDDMNGDTGCFYGSKKNLQSIAKIMRLQKVVYQFTKIML